MRLGIQRICVPTDFSPAADHAVHFAAALANTYNAELCLLHVIEHAGPLVHHPDFTGGGEVAREYLNRLGRAVEMTEAKLEAETGNSLPQVSDLIRALEAGAVEKIESVGNSWWAGLEVHRDVRYGHAVKEILHYLEIRKIDLVVMGTHGHNQFASMLLGSVTEKVARLSPCPVTIVRHPEHRYQLTQ